MRLHLGLAMCCAAMIASAAGGQEFVAPGAVAIVSSQAGKIYLLKGGRTGSVLVVDNGKAVSFAEGFEDPRGLTPHLDGLFVVGKDKIWFVDAAGKIDVRVAADQFPTPPVSLKHVVSDTKSGTLFICDGGDGSGKGAAIYKLDGMDKKMTVITDSSKITGLKAPDRLLRDGASRLYVTDPAADAVFYVNVATGAAEKDLSGITKARRLAWDLYGRLYAITDSGLVVVPPETRKPVAMQKKVPANADLFIGPDGKNLMVLNPQDGSVQPIRAQVPGMEVDDSPLPVETALAFANIQWTGWTSDDDKGLPNPFRPIVLTHAGDGSGRYFVATQQGVVHVFNAKDEKTKIFLDLTKKIHIDLKAENEQGFLGLAFHPKYKANGEFFVFYTRRENKKINVISRMKVSKSDPNKAEAASEEVLLEIERPSWNRDGGSLLFGPDGFLYTVTGDGGPPGAPLVQKLDNLLGKVMRIDVDRKDSGKNYGIPKDNPFVGVAGARPEIWAYGIRNTWRPSFDKATGLLWGGENGQDIYDEIILIKKGGNYGWNNRESYHPYSPAATITKDNVEPIWEYTRPLGLAVVGGAVYRGKSLPDLNGYYLYGDYITQRLWGLRYDADKGRVVANRAMPNSPNVFISFGEDEQGELYILSETRDGRSIQKFVAAKGAKK